MVEQRQLSAGLRQPALEITPLRLARTSGRRDGAGQSLLRVDLRTFLFMRSPTHARLPLTMIKDTLTSGFFRYAKPIG
jgi:hypothetical protein